MLLAEVTMAANQNEIIPFGVRPSRNDSEPRSAISYLSSVQPVLIDQFIFALRPVHGYAAFKTFLDTFLTPLAPLLPRNAVEGFIGLQEQPFLCLYGEFWSKAMGRAVQLITCHSEYRDKYLSGEIFVQGKKRDQATLLDEVTSANQDICGLVFSLPMEKRSDFAERLPEYIGPKLGLPKV